MPTRSSRLTAPEFQAHRTRLLRLEQMGVVIGCAGDPPTEAARLSLEPTDYELPELCELPGGAIAVVVPVQMTIRISGLLITDSELTTPWDEFPLELREPEGSPYYQDLIGRMYHRPPKVLNRWLSHHVPLRPRQEEGIIFAYGWSDVPPECQDHALVTMRLLLIDQRRNQLRFDFATRVDRGLKRKHERLQRERGDQAPSTKRARLFEREDGQLGAQGRFAPLEESRPLPPGYEPDASRRGDR